MKQSEIRVNGSGRKIKLEHVSCNLCGNNDNREVFRARDDRFDTCDFEFPVVECKSCGLAYLNPRPDIESMHEFYPPHFFEFRDHKEKAKNKYKEEFRKIQRSYGRLLDIGCANGGFVWYAREQGFDAEGLEVSRNAQNPYKLKIHKSFKQLSDVSYDVVTAWAVFEHLNDPMGYFKEVERILKKKGEFVFLVPNFSSYRSKAMMYEDIPRHMYFYTAQTIKHYLTKVGLNLENIEQDNSVYYGGHRKFLIYLALQLIGRPFTRRHQENLWKTFRDGVTPLWELIYLSPFEHFDRIVHVKVTKWFANKGKNGTIILHVRKP